MEPKYRNKPSDEAIDRYCKKLEEFLSAHNVSISIKLWEQPLQFRSYRNGELIEITNEWIEKIVIDSDRIKNFEISLYWRPGINEDISEREIWSDACWIQNKIYRHLKLVPGNPLDKNDPYWKLWDHLEKLKE